MGVGRTDLEELPTISPLYRRWVAAARTSIKYSHHQHTSNSSSQLWIFGNKMLPSFSNVLHFISDP